MNLRELLHSAFLLLKANAMEMFESILRQHSARQRDS